MVRIVVVFGRGSPDLPYADAEPDVLILGEKNTLLSVRGIHCQLLVLPTSDITRNCEVHELNSPSAS